MATKMVDMGIKRKDLYPSEPSSPKSESNYENEKVRPELDLSGPHAEMMGGEDLKEGDRIRQTVEWVVKRHSKTTEGGKTRYSMTLCLDKASDCEECDSDSEEEKEDEPKAAAKGDSPAMAYIRGGAAAEG